MTTASVLRGEDVESKATRLTAWKAIEPATALKNQTQMLV